MIYTNAPFELLIEGVVDWSGVPAPSTVSVTRPLPKSFYLSDELIKSVRRMGGVPKTGALGTNDEDLLWVLYETMLTKIFPRVIGIREEYFVQRVRVPVSGQEVRIPDRAFLNKLRQVFLWTGTERRELRKITVDEMARILPNSATGITRYYPAGNYIILVGGAPAGTVELHYFARPGKLVLPAAARQVADVDPSTRTVTLVSAAPDSWQDAAIKVDVHSHRSGAELKMWDEDVDVSGDTLTFASPVDGSDFGTEPIERGDWVCLQEEAVVPALPVEFHPLLVVAAALRASVNGGDVELAKAHAAELAPDLQSMLSTAESRVEGSPPRIKGWGGIFRRRS